jgi:hypothetical protein
MARRSEYPRRRRRPTPHQPHKSFEKQRVQRLKAGADTKLKKVFAGIGVPGPKAFKPDPYQLEAVAAVKRSDCLVTAPTGAGKTWIALQAITHLRSKGGSAWYASPLKALSNAKYAEFSGLVPAGASKKMVLHKKVREFIGSQHPPRLAPPGRLPPFGQILGVLKRFAQVPSAAGDFLSEVESRLRQRRSRCAAGRGPARNAGPRQQRLSRADRRTWQGAEPACGRPPSDWTRCGSWRWLAHHSGQLPSWKILVETLMLRGPAWTPCLPPRQWPPGVNFPARTIVPC